MQKTTRTNQTSDAQLLASYARGWGASSVPFQVDLQAAWLQTQLVEKATRLLDQSAALRSVMLLAGPNGVGKSALAGRWLRGLDPRLYHGVGISHATLSGLNLLGALCAQLDKCPAGRRDSNLSLIAQALEELGPRILVVVLDEAQNFSPTALEEIRLLLGFNLREKPAFALILIGDEYLLNALRLRHHRALYSRIGCYHHLDPWTPTQIHEYLQSALAAVGINRQAFEPAALELLTSASGGIARSLCLLAQTAWIEASAQTAQSISSEHVQRAIDQVPCTPGMQLPTGQTSTA